ncbi:uncharacterized protein B0I36DRAFT_337322 [Microdochium trichocladiopsis]|uniref:Uncharacterized protein n=1 Tax=Microdochium trichocladiopsis TaxID=1682393 RepID=A0A9P9BJ15_9PEZI|nr:uncharacterized protein B0I36DRAFT_337322 [Microdochium trichocladiopsis]KAH7016316.1 hypothetical protein B0I36DRAFT_337322 [Microdochium trichocladiopsis]
MAGSWIFGFFFRRRIPASSSIRSASPYFDYSSLQLSWILTLLATWFVRGLSAGAMSRGIYDTTGVPKPPPRP